jgi:hypothetical protein
VIRLIRIGGQIMEGNEDFAFWDTVRDRFIEITGSTVFPSERAFIDDCRCHGGDGEDIIFGGFNRLEAFVTSSAVRNGGWIKYEDDCGDAMCDDPDCTK